MHRGNDDGNMGAEIEGCVHQPRRPRRASPHRRLEEEESFFPGILGGSTTLPGP